MKKKIFIGGMSCEHCSAHVKEALTDLGGKNVEVSLEGNFAEGEFDCTDEEIVKAINEEGYDVTEIA